LVTPLGCQDIRVNGVLHTSAGYFSTLKIQGLWGYDAV
jgi:hypothetical protein